MKAKSMIVLSALTLFPCVLPHTVRAEGSYEKLTRQIREQEAKEAAAKASDKPQSIWDDQTEANPYFKSDKKSKVNKPAKEKSRKKIRRPKRSTFKRRVYTGPSKEEIASAAVKKAVANFNSFLTSKDYEVRYEDIKYDVAGDVLTVKKIMFVPAEKDNEKNVFPYLMKADEIILRNSNIGEKSQTPLTDDGEMTVRKLEIPVWNGQGIKKGKVDVAQLTVTGDIPAYLKGKGEGMLKTLEAKDVHSEKIINETILNNVIRSKVFSAADVALKDVTLNKQFVNALKQQEIDGVTFSSARINGENISTSDGVKAAMLSYSARILNTDLVLGARLEAEKENPAENPDLELLKKNVEENKAEIEKAITEFQ